MGSYAVFQKDLLKNKNKIIIAWRNWEAVVVGGGVEFWFIDPNESDDSWNLPLDAKRASRFVDSMSINLGSPPAAC